jgi:Na+-translocating ferredoxin:NAD+ oxidoreductase RnfA subunit
LKKQISLVVSTLFSMALLAGVFLGTCENLPVNALLGSSIGIVLVVYAFATAFALLGTIFQYFYLFANRGTASQPRMSRGLAWILLAALVVYLVVLRWSAANFCH